MNRVKEVERINRADVDMQLKANTVGDAGKWDISRSWHAQYKDSAYVYVGGLPYDLSEGDVIVIFSQFGEIVDVNLPRDKDTGKPKGFAFIAYEDQRSTVLAVDNFNGAKVLGRTVRCDHCLSFHEEQKKDAEKLPDHVTRKLNEAELAEKKKDIERRNAELDEAATSKADLFSVARGTADSEEVREEREIRASIMHQRESERAAKRTSHIESVLAKRKNEYQSAMSEEERLTQQREERRRQREEEARRAVSDAPPEPPPAAVTGAAPDAAAESRWERMMNGGGRKKKKKRPRAEEGGDDDTPRAPAAPAEPPGERRPGEGISVDETNRLRESLGLKPLRG